MFGLEARRALADSERARHGLEEIAVGFGRCTEPTNLQAGGRACPLRSRCPGCDHFNTDVSYLGDLLRSRERILAMAATTGPNNRPCRPRRRSAGSAA